VTALTAEETEELQRAFVVKLAGVDSGADDEIQTITFVQTSAARATASVRYLEGVASKDIWGASKLFIKRLTGNKAVVRAGTAGVATIVSNGIVTDFEGASSEAASTDAVEVTTTTVTTTTKKDVGVCVSDKLPACGSLLLFCDKSESVASECPTTCGRAAQTCT